MRICVYCSASEAIDDKYVELAGALGEAIAKRGWSLVWGGGQISMMGAVSRACREAGGRTVGVIPKKLADIEFADHHADELHIVDDMRVRKALMDDFPMHLLLCRVAREPWKSFSKFGLVKL